MVLDADEYGKFHARLMKLLMDNDDPDDDLTPEEAQIVLDEDFKADAGEDGSVDKQVQLFLDLKSRC